MRSLVQKIVQEDDKMDLMIRVHDTGKYGKDIMCRVDRWLERMHFRMPVV